MMPMTDHHTLKQARETLAIVQQGSGKLLIHMLMALTGHLRQILFRVIMDFAGMLIHHVLNMNFLYPLLYIHLEQPL
jgi:hypothetical protein